MTDVNEFLDDLGILEHDRDAAKVREYNRQYYLKNRKLKGRNPGDGVLSPPKVPVPPRQLKRGESSKEERANIAREKIRRAREKAKNLPDKDRNALEKKLDAAEKKLNKLKGLNPFADKKKSEDKPEWSSAKDVSDKQHKNSAERKKIMAERKKKRLADAKKRAAAAKREAVRKNKLKALKKVVEIEKKIDKKVQDVQSAPGRKAREIGAMPRKAGDAARKQVRDTKAKARATRKAAPIAGKVVVRRAAKDAVNKIFGG